MNPILRNFINVLRRFQLAAALNILGLSVAFAAFMVIMIQLDYDWSFDKFHKDYDKIFRLEVVDEGEIGAICTRPFAELFFASSPHIIAGTITKTSERNLYFYVENDGIRDFYKEKSIKVSPEFTDVFTFDFVEGHKEALRVPDNIIIPLSLAHKAFGDESAVGQQFFCEQGNLTVGGVYRDFPINSIINNLIYLPIPENEDKKNWLNWGYNVFIRVNEASNASMLFENFKSGSYAPAVWGEDNFDWDEEGCSLRLTALSDIHFVTDVTWDNTPKSSKQTLLILLAIAIAIVAIAAINFTNFSTALSPVRIKSINTQRVLGAGQFTLRLSLVLEAVFISLFSCVVALLFIILFQHTLFAKFIDADLSLTAHPMIVGGAVFVALLVGLFAGFYPARYMTSFSPAFVLKGGFGLSPKGRALRNTLISIQFVASFALIIGTLFMYLQNRFMQHSPLGYDKDALITVDIGQIQRSRDALTNNLKSYSGIEDVTYAEHLLSSSDRYQMWGLTYKGNYISFQVFPVHYTFMKVMGIEVTQGRDFRPEDSNTLYGTFILNETAQNKYNLELNTMIGGRYDIEVIGFISDIKFASFRTAVEPMAFQVCGTKNWDNTNQAYIKVKAGADVCAAKSHIRTTLSEFDADYPFEVRFFDEVLQRLYEKERSLGSLITLFSLIAIFISIVGVFGLVVFDSESRRKEIGIRKVHGSSIAGILIMFNKAYFKILLICFAVAAPLAWYAVSRWLQNFAYKTPMYWWVYLIAFVAVGIITASTVTFQNWRVANENPVNAM